MTTPQSNSYRAGTAIGTVFQRELRENLLKKSSIITLVITVLLTVGGVTAAWYFTKDESAESTKVAVVGEAPFAKVVADISAQLADANRTNKAAADSESKPGAKDAATSDSRAAEGLAQAQSIPFASALGISVNKVELVPVANADAAREAVSNGDAAAALYPAKQPGQWVLLDDDAPSWLPSMFQEALTSQTEAQQIADLGGNPTEFAQNVAGAKVSVEKLEQKNIDYTAIIVIGIGVMVMMTGILMFGGAVAQSVIEEKSSRVIEIMLATVRPLHLLIGKILGAAVAGLAMLTTIIVAAVISILVTGLADSFDIPWASMGLLLPYFLVGYFFFAAMYATAGSMVSRMEDFAGAQTPVVLLSLITIYVPAFGWQSLDSTFMQVMAWIPPVSVTVAPLQYASGNFSVAQLAGSLAVTVLVTAGVVAMAAKIYPRNVLRTGAPVSWRQALTRS